MRTQLLRTVAALLGLALAAGIALAEEKPDAAALHARGRAQLAKADFEDALVSFRAAARAAPRNQAYATDALVLRRIIGMRKTVATSKPGPKWARTATALHVFYLRRGLPAEAVELDRRGLSLLADASAEARLAEALLEADDAAAVVTLLDAKATWVRDSRHQIYRGIALARLERYDAAFAVQRALRVPKTASAMLLREAARLHGVLGLEAPCAASLVRCFERTPPANLEALKARVRAHPDFRRVAAGPLFVKALTTASTVEPTGCSGGKDCGSCPSRGSCGGKG